MDNEFVRSIETALAAIDEHSFALLVALSGVGIVTMALLQLFKDLLPTRRWYQQQWFHAWFVECGATQGLGESKARQALNSLVDLATAGNAKALFELPVEQFTGQLNAAVQAMLDYPDRYEPLLRILAQRVDPKDIRVLAKPRPAAAAALEQYLQCRNRVAQQIQRTLDAVQISMGSRWRTMLHWLSFGVSATVIFVALTLYGRGTGFWTSERLGYAFVVAVLGGFIAPVARDLVAAIQNLRGRAKV